jgi:hypothetical protein
MEGSYQARLESAEAVDRTGSESLARWTEGTLADHAYRRGDWDTALTMIDDFLAGVASGSPNVLEWQVRALRAEMRLANGDAAGALADTDAALAAGRAIGEVQAVCFVLASAAHVRSIASKDGSGVPVALELLESLRAGGDLQFAVVNLPLFAAAVDGLGLAEELLDALEGQPATPWLEVARAYVARDFVAAAELLREIGTKPDEAEARLLAGEQLVAESRRVDADEQLRRALDFYRSVDAQLYVRRCERAQAPD